jgi:hypothetical protein
LLQCNRDCSATETAVLSSRRRFRNTFGARLASVQSAEEGWVGRRKTGVAWRRFHPRADRRWNAASYWPVSVTNSPAGAGRTGRASSSRGALYGTAARIRQVFFDQFSRTCLLLGPSWFPSGCEPEQTSSTRVNRPLRGTSAQVARGPGCPPDQSPAARESHARG